jgi:hypothetical protein
MSKLGVGEEIDFGEGDALQPVWIPAFAGMTQ